MSDDAIRSLERAVAATPDDATLRSRLGAELVRAGERRRGWCELARAAREGDAEARAALRRWSPWSGAGRMTSRRIPRAARTIRRVVLADLPPNPDRVYLPVAASDGHLVLSNERTLVSADLARQEVSCVLEGVAGPGGAYLAGDLLVQVAVDGLALRHVATGEVLRRADSPLPPYVDWRGRSHRCEVLMGTADRMLVHVLNRAGEHELAVVDVGDDFGRTIARHQRPSGSHATTFDLALFASEQIQAFRLSDGVSVFAGAVDGFAMVWLRGADDRGAVLEGRRAGVTQVARAQHLLEVQLPDLAPRWSTPFVLYRQIVGPEVVVAVGKAGGTRSQAVLACVDRESGAIRWRRRGVVPFRVNDDNPSCTLALDDRTVVVAVGGRSALGLEAVQVEPLRLTAFDLASGEPLWEHRADVQRFGPVFPRCELLPLDDRLVVAIGDDSPTLLVVE